MLLVFENQLLDAAKVMRSYSPIVGQSKCQDRARICTRHRECGYGYDLAHVLRQNKSETEMTRSSERSALKQLITTCRGCHHFSLTLQDRDRPANPHPAVAGQPDFSGFVGPERKNGRPVMRHRRTGIAWGPSLELSFLPQNPKAGDLISGPDGARKVRFAVRG